MADTSQHQEEVTEPPQTNGVLDDGLTEEERSKMRPADIDADMKEMERRKRVEMMMNSRLFREELERIIESQMKDGSGPSGLLQQISEMMGHQGARFNTSVFKNSNCVVPINDIRGVESMGYAKGEKLLRCKLAAVFRLLDLYGWTQGVGGMITARLNQDQEHFLVNPYGLLYHEVTASSLVKADMQGGVVEQGTTNFGVHIAGYQLHSTIHAARPDIKCIVHIATPSVTAVSSTKCGILPLGQESIVIGEVSAHHYVSAGPLDPDEREKLARNFGPINKVMLLTNRGALCCGETVEEAFFNVYNTVLACETQLKLMPLGVDNLTLITDEARKAIYEASRKAPVPQSSSVAEPSPLAEKLEKRWRIGGTEFEALMRMLDNAGFRTGYIYRHPLVKSEPPRPRNDVEVPPAVSSLGYLLEEEELYKQGLWKGGRKGNDRTRWLNSPNVYQKVEILETGTPDPKKITKWVSDGSPTHSSTPVKIDGALQFVPKNTNPKEFKQLQQQIKDYRRADKISAGPQSHILEGVTWEEAKKMQDATISGTGEQVVLVGAASKGIIQRGFQHNAMVYKTPYAKNPFDAVTDQELDQYKKEIERKTKGDIYDESQSESEALSSFNISRATHESSTAKSPIQSPVSVTSETEEESRDEPKVLRIETKQVPAPSQPEVVLSDERSVKNPVMEISNALREDVKSEPLEAQKKVNVPTVNADFLNEQRRSEMMTRRNANGRGVSGVTRLSSRSTSSIDECWSSLDNYDDCVLETTRAQELPRPMKPLMTNVQNCFTVKHKTKHNFSDNCENRVKNNIQTGSNCKSQDSDVTRNLENAAIKLERYNLQLIAEKYKQRHRSRKWQKQSSTETETTNIQYTKGADLDFAEKVILPVECSVKEHKINHVNGNDAKTIQHIAELTKNNVEKAANLYNIKLDVLTDNRSNNDENQGKALQPQKELSKNLESLEENRNIDIYVNEVELAESYGKVEGTTQQSQRELSNNFESSEQNGNIDIYVNEVQFPESYGKIKENTLQYRKGLTTKLESLDDNRNTGIYVNKLQENIGQRGFVPNNGVNKLDNNNTIYESGCILSSLENSFNSTLISSDSETNNNMKNSKLLSVCHNASLENVPDVDDKTVHSRSLEHSLETPVDLSKYGLSSQLQNFEDNTISSCAEEEIISSQNQTLDIKSSIKERYENESSVLDHSTPLENNTIEKNSIGTRMNEHVESRRRLLMNNTENRENFHFTLNQRKLGKRDDSWTIDRSQTNFFDDETRQFTNLSIPDKQNLDFTFSDSERSTEDLSAASTPRTSFCIDDESGSERISRDDSIGEVVCSIDANIKPSTRHLIDHLADTENSSKYNLDSQNMNLIYSLTPPNDIGDSSRNTTLEDNFEDYEDKRHDKDDADNEYYEDDENAIQINLSNTNRQETSVCKIIELSDMTFHSIISNSGSDLLDLPKDTYQDFQKSSEETFHKNISTSADQVINELDLAEIQISAANFVDEMIFDIYCLNLSRDLSSRFSNKKELTNFIKDKTSALVFVRRLARDLVNHLPYSEVSTTSHTKVSKSNEDLSTLETLDESVYIIHEFIHHIVDKNSLGKSDSKFKKIATDKRAKESMNIELKSLNDDYDVTDEKSLKCSTPIRTRNNSFSEEQSLLCVDNGIEFREHVEQHTTDSKRQQSLNTITSANSSPSTGTQNFAEQEVTSESTDSDTKSDDSKEKQTDTCETLKNNQSSSNQVISKLSSDSPEPLATGHFNKREISRFPSQEISFCVIEYAGECGQIHTDHFNEYVEGEKEFDSDLDVSVKEFMENFMNSPEKIEAMWKNSELKSDEAYASERLAEITNKNFDQDCEEKINEICQQIQNDAATMIVGIEEQSTSFIVDGDEIDNTIDSHHQFEKMDECCTCCKEADTSIHLQNTSNELLPTITEEPELESFFYIDPADVSSGTLAVTKSYESLPPIFEEPELNLPCDDHLEKINDSQMTEFYSCHNSASMKSCDEIEITNNTYTLSTQETNNHEGTYSADILTNDDISAATVILKSESTTSEHTSACNRSTNITENYTDDSCASLADINNEEVVLEYMTYSYDTKEFMKLEIACSDSSDDSNYINVTTTEAEALSSSYEHSGIS